MRSLKLCFVVSISVLFSFDLFCANSANAEFSKKVLKKAFRPLKNRKKFKRSRVAGVFLINPSHLYLWLPITLDCQAVDKHGEKEVDFHALIPLKYLREVISTQEDCAGLEVNLRRIKILGETSHKREKKTVWSGHLPAVLREGIKKISPEYDSYFVLCCGYRGKKKDDIQIGVTGKTEKSDRSQLDGVIREFYEETSIDLRWYGFLLTYSKSVDSCFVFTTDPIHF